MKTRIVEFLGHGELVLPQLVEAGLAANDRAKVRLAILQAAAQHALAPNAAAADLADECRRVGIEAAPIQALIQGAVMAPDDTLSAPGLARLTDDLRADVETMIDGVAAGEPETGVTVKNRLQSIAAVLAAAGDRLRRSEIARLIDVADGDALSVHRLVMDLHKALNRLSAGCSDEIVAGARVRGLVPDDLPIVTAFMKGLERTRALKFDHPGLETTAARSGRRVIIQNDIGTTDAHVIVVGVDGLTVTVNYTDVHRPRAAFFVDLFGGFAARWSGLNERTVDGLAKNDAFYMVTGTFEAQAPQDRDAFLEEVGASLVFLIDWNKARKRLQNLVNNKDAVRILAWAAHHRFGHRAFLELGGSELVASAARHAAPVRIGFGQRLDAVLGREGAVDFLQNVMKISADALLAGRSVRLARDAVEADLVARLERTDSTLLAVVVCQAGLAREISARLAHFVADRRVGRAADGAALALRAKYIEEKADRIAVDTRKAIAAFEAAPSIVRLVDAVEDAIDELEQAAFTANYLPGGMDASDWRPLEDLCAAAIAGAEAIAMGIEAALTVPEGRRADSDDAMEMVSRLVDIEHAADAAERAATGFVLDRASDVRAGLAILEFARAIERATDRLASVGHHLYDHVMSDLTA